MADSNLRTTGGVINASDKDGVKGEIVKRARAYLTRADEKYRDAAVKPDKFDYTTSIKIKGDIVKELEQYNVSKKTAENYANSLVDEMDMARRDTQEGGRFLKSLMWVGSFFEKSNQESLDGMRDRERALEALKLKRRQQLENVIEEIEKGVDQGKPLGNISQLVSPGGKPALAVASVDHSQASPGMVVPTPPATSVSPGRGDSTPKLG